MRILLILTMLCIGNLQAMEDSVSSSSSVGKMASACHKVIMEKWQEQDPVVRKRLAFLIPVIGAGYILNIAYRNHIIKTEEIEIPKVDNSSSTDVYRCEFRKRDEVEIKQAICDHFVTISIVTVLILGTLTLLSILIPPIQINGEEY